MAETAPKEIFYKKTYSCLLDGASFDVFKMKPSARKKYERLDEYYDHPYYDADPLGAFTNGLLMDVRVCPQCAFASVDDTQFKTDSSFITPVEFKKSTVRHVLEQAAKRAMILGTTQTMYQCPRSNEDAIASYKMAILTATALYNSEPRMHAPETLRLANYALRLARISQEMGQTEMREGWRRAAYEYLGKAYESDVEGASRYKGLYQYAALAIYLDDDKVASRIFSNLKKLASTEGTRDLNRYLNRLKNIWDNRDMYRKESQQKPV